jgi:hypothetical protein
MLKPYVCVACEKVIVAQDGVASLIALFSKIILTVPAGTEIPPNAVAPKEWAVFSIWDPEPGDERRNYFLCTQILYPDESQFGQITRSKFNIEVNKRSQMTLQVQGFPIGQTGEYTILSWVEENEKKVSDPIQFGIEVIINFAASPAGAAT